MHDPAKVMKFPDLDTLGKRVRQIRKAEGLSQKKLGDLVGCSHVSILNLEKGTGKINLSTTWRILETLGMVK